MARDDDVKVWMPLYVRDFLTDTEGLTADEGWAYTRLLCHLWVQQGYLDANPRALAQLGQVPPAAWPAVWRRLERLFDVQEGRISQKRLLHELEEAREKRIKKREAGQAGATARWKVKRRSATHGEMRSQCPSPSPSPTPSSAPPPAEGEADRRSRAPAPLRWATDAFCAAWKSRYGDDYAVTDRDRAYLGRVLRDLSPEQAAALPACFVAYTRDEDRFLVEKQRHSLWFFCKQDGQNKYRVRQPPIRSEKEVRTATAVERFINGGIDGRQSG